MANISSAIQHYFITFLNRFTFRTFHGFGFDSIKCCPVGSSSSTNADTQPTAHLLISRRYLLDTLYINLACHYINPLAHTKYVDLKK